MIYNREFKRLKFYRDLLAKDEQYNVLDQFSIIKSFSDNIVRGKKELLIVLNCTEDKLNDILLTMEDIEIINSYSFKIGDSYKNSWLVFSLTKTGSFVFKHVINQLDSIY